MSAPGQFGFSLYTARIIEGLSAHADEVAIHVPDSARDALDPRLLAQERVSVREVPFDLSAHGGRTERDIAWYQHALSEALAADSPDVCLGPSQFLPLNWHGPRVVTIHDLIFERYPAFFTPANHELYTTWSRRAAEAADGIVTVSESAAEDVRTIWGFRDKPVVAAPLASGLAFVPTDREQSRGIVADRLGIDGPYVLNVASGHPRKNLRGCVQAFAALREKGIAPRARLLLVNLDVPWVHDLVAEFDVTDRTTITPALDARLLPHVYAGAHVLLHPSFAEGFGLPVLEAMACGTPVVSSTRPSIPEVAGDAALLVDPEDPAAVADALRQTLTDQDLADALSVRGRRRAAAFDWHRTAERTRDLLARVCRQQ